MVRNCSLVWLTPASLWHDHWCRWLQWVGDSMVRNYSPVSLVLWRISYLFQFHWGILLKSMIQLTITHSSCYPLLYCFTEIYIKKKSKSSKWIEHLNLGLQRNFNLKIFFEKSRGTVPLRSRSLAGEHKDKETRSLTPLDVVNRRKAYDPYR